jgi:hypothetical protein
MEMERKIINFNVITPLLLLLVVLMGCSRVNTSKDKSASLNTYKTYSWKKPDVKSDNPLYKGDLIDQSIRESLENELSQKGMVRDDENPDVYVKYHTLIENKQGVTSAGYTPFFGPMGYFGPGSGFGYGGGYYGGYYNNYYGYGTWSNPIPYTYTEETLILDFIDAKTDRVVWRGSIANDVTDASDLDEKMEESVHSIVKKFRDDQEDI